MYLRFKYWSLMIDVWWSCFKHYDLIMVDLFLWFDVIHVAWLIFKINFIGNNTSEASVCHYWSKKLPILKFSTKKKSMNICPFPFYVYHKVYLAILRRLVYFELRTVILRYQTVFFSSLYALCLYLVVYNVLQTADCEQKYAGVRGVSR